MNSKSAVKRWFKRRLWHEIFSNILDFFPHTTAIALVDRDGPFLQVSKDENFYPSPPDLIYPLTLENKEVVNLHIWAESPEEANKYWKTVLPLLQIWFTTEYSKRAVTEEALDRYRELSFLNHIAFALNSSLDLTKVASTLIEECRRAVPIAKYGAVCLIDKNKRIFKPLAYFGEDIENIVEKVTETQLFKEIVESGKAEIVNQVGGDLRWNAFVPQIISFL